jgi:hypothetical protein
MKTLMEQRAQIQAAARSGWESLLTALEKNANRNIVDVAWDVTYDELGHDIIIESRLKVRAVDTWLLQIWLKDLHPGTWIPELLPWVSGVIEFEPDQRVTKAHCAVFDSKWRTEDAGVEYHAVHWGFVDQGGNAVQFGPFVKKFVFPG